MIIECINCYKKFDVNSDLIPSNGRTIQCGSCNHVWFYKKDNENPIQFEDTETIKNNDILTKKKQSKKNPSQIKKNKEKLFNQKKLTNSDNRGLEIVQYNPKSNFTFAKSLSYIVVIVISLVAIILILDTFKSPLYNLFPNLELILFSLYETLKDIKLFIKDLI